MTLEQQLVSPGLAKRLKELGVNIDTIWYLTQLNETIMVSFYNKTEISIYNYLPCPSLTELLDIMPSCIKGYDFIIYKDRDGDYWVNYTNYSYCDTVDCLIKAPEVDSNPCNAVAKCLIYLLTPDSKTGKSIITVKDLKI